MGFTEVIAEVDNLSSEERRKVLLHILELEKDRVQKKYGPRIAEELDGLGKFVQDSIEKLKQVVNKP